MMRKSWEGFKKIPNYGISEKRSTENSEILGGSKKRKLVIPWKGCPLFPEEFRKILFHSLLEIFMNFKP